MTSTNVVVQAGHFLTLARPVSRMVGWISVRLVPWTERRAEVDTSNVVPFVRP